MKISWPIVALGACQTLTAILLLWLADTPWRWLGLPLAAVGVAGLAWSLRVRSATDLDKILSILESVNADALDLTRRIEATEGDDAKLGEHLNRVLERMRTAVIDLQEHSLKVALASAHGLRISEAASGNAKRQEEYSELIFRSSDENAAAIGQISERANTIAAVNSRNLESARNSLANLRSATENIGSVAELLEGFHNTVARLESSSTDIRNILGTVQSFAAQTNMLAKPGSENKFCQH